MSIVRHAQPIAAISRARAARFAWLLPDPCRNSTPGMRASGTISVAAMQWPPTAISNVSSRVNMARDHDVLGQPAAVVVGTVEVDRRAFRHPDVVAVDLGRRCAHAGKRWIVAERRERGDLGAARAAEAPRLLEHAEAPLARRVDAFGDVVIAPRREQAFEAFE